MSKYIFLFRKMEYLQRVVETSEKAMDSFQIYINKSQTKKRVFRNIAGNKRRKTKTKKLRVRAQSDNIHFELFSLVFSVFLSFIAQIRPDNIDFDRSTNLYGMPKNPLNELIHLIHCTTYSNDTIINSILKLTFLMHENIQIRFFFFFCLFYNNI